MKPCTKTNTMGVSHDYYVSCTNSDKNRGLKLHHKSLSGHTHLQGVTHKQGIEYTVSRDS